MESSPRLSDDGPATDPPEPSPVMPEAEQFPTAPASAAHDAGPIPEPDQRNSSGGAESPLHLTTDPSRTLGRVNRLRTAGTPSRSDTWQRWVMLTLSLSVTTLVVGVVLGAWWYSAKYERQLADAEYLQSRLAAIGEDPQSEATSMPPALVRVARIDYGTIQPTRPVFGRLVEYRKVTISSEVEGKIIELPVEDGTPVQANKTLLAHVDEVWSKLAVAQTSAELDSITAQLAQETQELDRLRQLAAASSVTISDLESQDSLVRQLQATKAKTEAVLEEKRERLTRAKIYAPFDGTIVKKHAEIGQTLAVGDPVVEIVSRGTIDAELRVPESLVDRIHVGMPIPVAIEPLQLKETGQVVAVIPYGPTASRTFPVRLRLQDQGGRLKVGMSVHAIVPESEPSKQLLVNKNGVLERPDGCTVWVVLPAASNPEQTGADAGSSAGPAPRRALPVPVRIVARDGDVYAIRPEAAADEKRLKPGTEVVIEGAERLTPQQQVRIVKMDPAYLENLPQASGHEVVP